MQRWSHLLAMLVGVASPVLLHGQFQKPSQEELAMTADAKAPGAAAVYLDIDDTTDDMLHSRIFYARIKVLKESGKEAATVELPRLDEDEVDKDFATMQLPYQSTNMQLGQPAVVKGSRVIISDFKGRTIHPDGTIVPLEGKLGDFIKRDAAGPHAGRSVVTLPGVELGSVIEYRFVERYDGLYSSPHWEIQRDYFVHKAHFTFLPYKSYWTGLEGSVGSYLVDRHGSPLNYLVYYPKLPSHAQINRDGTQHFYLDVADVPAAPHEEWMPPIGNQLYSVLFYYRSDSDAKDFWTKQTKLWSKKVDRLAEPTAAIKDAVTGLTGKGDDDLEKAKKLYKAAQSLENTDFTLRTAQNVPATKEKTAEETWAQKSGSSEDIAILYLAMLRAAGLTAYDMKVVNRDRSVFAPEYLYLDQLDDDVILLDVKESNDGKEIVLDPGQKMCPFGVVHWKHTGAGGIRQGWEGKQLYVTPFQPYTSNMLVRMGDIQVGDHGGLAGNFRFMMTGQEALRWRQQNLLSDSADFKAQFEHWLESSAPSGMKLDLDRFEALSEPDSSLVAYVGVKGALASLGGAGFALPSFPFAVTRQEPFVDETQRETPIDMHYGGRVTDQVTYRYPAGMKIAGIPQDTVVPWESHAVFAVKVKATSGEVTIARSLDRAFALASVKDFQGLHDFYGQVEKVDKQQLTLNPTTSFVPSAGEAGTHALATR